MALDMARLAEAAVALSVAMVVRAERPAAVRFA
jgi:hypothetical protein